MIKLLVSMCIQLLTWTTKFPWELLVAMQIWCSSSTIYLFFAALTCISLLLLLLLFKVLLKDFLFVVWLSSFGCYSFFVWDTIQVLKKSFVTHMQPFLCYLLLFGLLETSLSHFVTYLVMVEHNRSSTAGMANMSLSHHSQKMGYPWNVWPQAWPHPCAFCWI